MGEEAYEGAGADADCDQLSSWRCRAGMLVCWCAVMLVCWCVCVCVSPCCCAGADEFSGLGGCGGGGGVEGAGGVDGA
eukprot:9740768-Alexandrium_andersonii.AAC.1